MKTVFFFAIMIAGSVTVKSQELLFKVNQFGIAHKNSKTGKFSDAEVNDTNTTIILQNKKVLVDGDTKTIYTLYKKISENKINNDVISYSYYGKDEKNSPISFVYTVNRNSNDAVIEVSNDKLKSYYFGSYSASDLTGQR